MAMYRTFNSETTQIKIKKIFGQNFNLVKSPERFQTESSRSGQNALVPIPKPAPEFWKYPLDYRNLK